MSETIAESRPVQLRIDEPEYKIDLSDTPVKVDLRAAVDYGPNDKALP